jgi:6-phospho-beta-glucosidase
VKIAVIGGGSTYTPELVNGFLERVGKLPLTELWLMDIDPARLEVVGGFARRMVTARGEPFQVHLTTDRQEAVQNASFVVTQLRVGGMQARREDEYMGKRWKLVGQETTGIGGFAKALRTIPVLLEVARDMQRLCPQAWLINFTNPSGLVTEALQRYAPETRSVGLCNGPLHFKMRIAGWLNADPGQVYLDYLGINHLAWITGATVAGENVWPQALTCYLEELRQEEEPAVPPYLAELLQTIPSGYLRYFYRTEAVLAAQETAAQSRAEQVMAIEADLLAKYADPNLTAPPPELEKRGGAYYSTAAALLIDSLHSNVGDVHIVNTRHAGAVAGWPADWVAELPCRVDAAGIHPLPAQPLPVMAEGLLRAVKAYELLAAEAAVTGDRGAALQALVVHPLGPDADHAPAVLDDLLRVNAAYLPQLTGANDARTFTPLPGD